MTDAGDTMIGRVSALKQVNHESGGVAVHDAVSVPSLPGIRWITGRSCEIHQCGRSS